MQHAYGVGLAQRALGHIAQAGGALEEAESSLHAALTTFDAVSARFELGRTHLSLAALAHAQDNLATTTAHLSAAQALFETLQVPQYVERTAQLARACGVSLTTRPLLPQASQHNDIPGESAPPLPDREQKPVVRQLPPGPPPGTPAGLVVGRDAELDALQRCFEAASTGHRQMVFITGEAGIGKTTVVDAFVARIATTPGLRFATGQCIEHYGPGEAYRPIFEALGRLGRAAGGSSPSCASMRRRGWRNCRGSSVSRTPRHYSGGCWGQPRSACCGNAPRRWSFSLSRRRWCW